MDTTICRTEDPTLETVKFGAVYRIRAPRTGEPRNLYEVSDDGGVGSVEPLDDSYEYPVGYKRIWSRLTRLRAPRRPPLRGPRHAPRGAGVVGSHAVAVLATVDVWRRSNERWWRKPPRGECGGVSERLPHLYSHVHLHLFFFLLLLSILSSIVVTTVTTVGTFWPYDAKRSVARSVARSSSVAPRSGSRPTPLEGAAVDRRQGRRYASVALACAARVTDLLDL